MALSYKARRRWSLVILLFGLPAYIAAAWFLMSLFEVSSLFVEVLIYLALGVLWAIPFRSIFRGIGQADPDATPENDETPDR